MITSNRVSAILQRHDQLLDLAKQFANETRAGGRSGEVRIDYEGVSEHVNTACHCHPEYEWVLRGSMEEFQQWMDKQEK